MDKVNLAAKLASFSEPWQPRIIADLNGQQVKVAKLLGEFVWHHHEHEDELFLVLEGTLTMQFRDHEVQLAAGEMIVVPRGTEHRPVADRVAHAILLERPETKQFGD